MERRFETCRMISSARARCWTLTLFVFLISAHAEAQEAFWEVLPIKPFNFDLMLRQQTFAPDDREIGIQDPGREEQTR